MAKRSLQAAFPWGLLVISDAQSDLQVPDPTSPTQKISASSDAAVIEVLHGQFGDVNVNVSDENLETTSQAKTRLGECTLSIPSGRLVVGDVPRESGFELAVRPGRYLMEFYADSETEPEHIDIVYSMITEAS